MPDSRETDPNRLADFKSTQPRATPLERYSGLGYGTEQKQPSRLEQVPRRGH